MLVIFRFVVARNVWLKTKPASEGERHKLNYNITVTMGSKGIFITSKVKKK